MAGKRKTVSWEVTPFGCWECTSHNKGKDIEQVIAYQKDLVEVVHELRQVLCVKG
jgi:hypothetical protein